mmetsp:Transcript_126991/g.359411  ORF Transcript_126991/g.359411 Transcript_126991/m.359411 type:complete len:200 (-) Transcript_126991:1289-1888(-)
MPSSSARCRSTRNFTSSSSVRSFSCVASAFISRLMPSWPVRVSTRSLEHFDILCLIVSCDSASRADSFETSCLRVSCPAREFPSATTSLLRFSRQASAFACFSSTVRHVSCSGLSFASRPRSGSISARSPSSTPTFSCKPRSGARSLCSTSRDSTFSQRPATSSFVLSWPLKHSTCASSSVSTSSASTFFKASRAPARR